MCTVTWWLGAGAYEVLHNRDERRSRGPAHPPSVGELRGVRFIAPRDSDFGGAWIACNELGVTVCLLNVFGPEAPAGGAVSRGLLVLELADAGAPAEATGRLSREDLARFRPFVLAAFGPGMPPRLATWTGTRLEQGPLAGDRMPLVSSGRDHAAAFAARRAELDRLRAARGAADPATLRELHASHRPERGALSACMHRDDAATVSSSRVRVGPAGVEFSYCPAAPCEAPFDPPLRLARRAPAPRP
ncbi:MAG: NRDE family protein [Acidobacteria bacterium]|nr:NRDE family protein [Acidobacteriota bacterium]